MESKFTPEQWEKTEKKVDTAEKNIRQSTISHVLEKGKTLENIANDESGEISDRRKKIAEKLKEKFKGRHKLNAEALDLDTKELLGDTNSPEQALVSLRYSNLRSALENEASLDEEREEKFEEEQVLLEAINDIKEKGGSAGEYKDELSLMRAEIQKIDLKKDELIKSTPEAYYGLHLKQLKKYKEGMDNGVIVETPYVKEQAERIVSALSAGQATFIYGHLGSGKTELAMHVAKNYILKDRPDLDKIVERELKLWLEKNPKAGETEQEAQKKQFDKIHRGAVVISGSKHLSLSEFYGHQILKLGEKDEEESKKLVEKVNGEFKIWEKNNPKAEEDEKNRVHNSMVAAYIQNKGGTISDFYLGPIYKAMEEGRPVIIDEVNVIPHEVLISLNHILTRKVGETVSVQQNSGSKVKIKEGFCIIMTGNLNTRKDVETYTDRKELDPAFLSRLDQIEHDYLPQRTDGTLDSDAGPDNQLFHLMLAKVMDRHGNIEVPKGEMRKLWNLALAARETQEVFSGKLSHKFKQGGGAGLPAGDILKKNVASIRAVDRIVTSWVKSGTEFELDYYVWDKFISNASDPMERALLYQMFREKGFFETEGWEKNPKYGSGGKLSSFEIKAPKNAVKGFDFFGARESVNFAFGKGPERTKWPEMKPGKKEKQEVNLEELQKLQETSEELRKKIKSLSGKAGKK